MISLTGASISVRDDERTRHPRLGEILIQPPIPKYLSFSWTLELRLFQVTVLFVINPSRCLFPHTPSCLRFPHLRQPAIWPVAVSVYRLPSSQVYLYFPWRQAYLLYAGSDLKLKDSSLARGHGVVYQIGPSTRTELQEVKRSFGLQELFSVCLFVYNIFDISKIIQESKYSRDTRAGVIA
jgi:hypothetical protein